MVGRSSGRNTETVNQAAILAEKYLRIQLFSNVLSALGYTLTSCIRAFGYPAIEMGIRFHEEAVRYRDI